jgi:hypothetical protein
MGEVEEKLEAYEVKREGEAEILMLKSNAVFFNPVQVHALLPPFPRFSYCSGENWVMLRLILTERVANSSGFKSIVRDFSMYIWYLYASVLSPSCADLSGAHYQY